MASVLLAVGVAFERGDFDSYYTLGRVAAGAVHCLHARRDWTRAALAEEGTP